MRIVFHEFIAIFLVYFHQFKIFVNRLFFFHTTSIDIDLLKALDIVEDVKRIQEPYKNANRKFHPADTVIEVGGVKIGGKYPIAIQSMTNTKTEDVQATVEQILKLEAAGCEIIRCTVPTMEAAEALREIKKQIHIPLVADIHFDYRLAIEAIRHGADKIRINPGNIGGEAAVRRVAECVRSHGIPVRVGANTGSIEQEYLQKYGRTARALVESALLDVSRLEKYGVEDIVISVKASSVPVTVEAYRMLAKRTNYPLHLGVTEAGTARMGLVKSAIGIGSLLADGIGDTIRVSLTDDPVEEVYAAKDILKAAGLRKEGVNIISCPTCGRTKIDLIGLVNQVDGALKDCQKPITVAVMGCIVNGPGEAREADIGIAGGDGCGMLFEKGQQIAKLPYDELLPALLKRIQEL